MISHVACFVFDLDCFILIMQVKKYDLT
uniref:Uncharacterized protein n=1 Tax=Solanum lycopersicum TaxID=4081 RepID=A0A3Q7I4I9_SOLLC